MLVVDVSLLCSAALTSVGGHMLPPGVRRPVFSFDVSGRRRPPWARQRMRRTVLTVLGVGGAVCVAATCCCCCRGGLLLLLLLLLLGVLLLLLLQRRLAAVNGECAA